MDQVRVLRVVIASPGDVKAEREIIPRVVEEVNRNIARDRGLRLEVYRWETDAYPGFHPEGPQGLIDPILKINDCDILIGIFWRRFGTPVNDAKSGTEHEFRLAYDAWKKNRKPQIMVYFSQKSYTPKSKEETDQWGLVLQFKEEFPTEGLWWDYQDAADFERLSRNHLTRFLSQQFQIDKPSTIENPSHERASSGVPTTPWHKENPFWGAISLFVALVLTGVGFGVSGHLTLGRWLLAGAWPLGVMAIWLALNGLSDKRSVRIRGRIAAVVGLGCILALGAAWMDTANTTAPETQQQTTPSQAPCFSSDLLSPLTITPVKLIFKNQRVGTTSNPQTITVVNRGSSRGIVSPPKMTGDFSQTNDCGPELLIGDSCNIAVTFAPTKLGLTYGSLEILSSNPLTPTCTSPTTATLSGSGKATVPAVTAPPKLASLPLVNCQPRGTSDSFAVGVAQKQGATMTSFATDGREDQKALFPRRPTRVLIEPPGLVVGVADLPKQVVLGKCSDHVCKLTVTEFADDGVTFDTRKATVFTEQQEICGVSVKMTVLDAK
jgi:hypothetical protein